MKKVHLFLAIASVIWVYIIGRAVNLSFTVDEATTYNFVVGIYADVLHSNNHGLNTQLMKLSLALFGSSEWALRLPNLLAFPVYAYAVWSLIKNANGLLAFVLGMVTMLFIPFGLEFFSLARGYGLSLAFAVLSFSLYMRSRGHQGKELGRWLLFSSISAMLAILANFNQFNFSMVLFGLLGFVLREQYIKGKINFVYVLSTGLIVLFTMSVSVYSLLTLQGDGDLNFGAPTYYAAFMRSIRLFTYLDGLPIYAMHLMIVALSLLLVTSLFILFRLKSSDGRMRVTLIFILGISLGWILEHEFFGANLPQGRMNLIYMPLIGFLLFVLAEQGVLVKNRLQILSKGVALVLILGYSLNFVLSVNLDHTRRWRDDAMTKDAILYVQEICAEWQKPATIERYWLFRHSTNYYIHSRELNVEWNLDKGIVGDADFVFIHTREWEQNRLKLKDNYRLIREYEDFPLKLYQHVRTIGSE